jgi:hypothetical protein
VGAASVLTGPSPGLPETSGVGVRVFATAVPDLPRLCLT